MTLAERLPTLDKDALINLHANARRLEAEGGRKQEEAALLIPLIEAELAEREANKPPKVVKPRKKKVVAAAVEA